MLPFIAQWALEEVDGVQRLTRSYTFKNFTSALAFANQLGAAAEAENHHPALLVEWGRVKVSWWTHVIGGLHMNDFILAARSDQIYLDGMGAV